MCHLSRDLSNKACCEYPSCRKSVSMMLLTTYMLHTHIDITESIISTYITLYYISTAWYSELTYKECSS